jgi:hypothetical protein
MPARKKGAAKMGRPAGPPETVRRNRVTFTLTDAELGKLRGLAEERGLPLGTAAYEIVAKVLRRRP